MTRLDHLIRLLIILGLVIMGLFITAALSMFVFMLSGISLSEASAMSQEGITDLPASTIRALLFIQHAFGFILPAILFAIFTYQRSSLTGLDLKRFPSLPLIGLAILFMVAAYPLVPLTMELNEIIPLPSWATNMEDAAADILDKIIVMDSPFIFLINLFLIAVIPGIGEELIFRGIIQKHLGGLLKNPVLAIWLAAFIFSAFHMQFEGFLPRLVLGAVLGYLYFWTKNLWVPIIVHAFNNGIQIIIAYTVETDVSVIDKKATDLLSIWMIILCIAAMYFIHKAILKTTHAIE
jgi:membrane protease YdiL (CAAX protease family)